MPVKKDLPAVLNDKIQDYLLNNVFTALPATIVSVEKYGTEQLIDVVPTVARVDKDGFGYIPQPIYDVPVVTQSGGGGVLTFPVAVNDTVLLVFSKRDMASWLDSEGGGTAVAPLTRRVFNITDAIAITGLFTRQSNLSPSTTDVELKYAGSSVSIAPNGDVTIQAVGDLVGNTQGNASIIASGDADIVASGDINLTGSTINLN